MPKLDIRQGAGFHLGAGSQHIHIAAEELRSDEAGFSGICRVQGVRDTMESATFYRPEANMPCAQIIAECTQAEPDGLTRFERVYMLRHLTHGRCNALIEHLGSTEQEDLGYVIVELSDVRDGTACLSIDQNTGIPVTTNCMYGKILDAMRKGEVEGKIGAMMRKWYERHPLPKTFRLQIGHALHFGGGSEHLRVQYTGNTYDAERAYAHLSVSGQKSSEGPTSNPALTLDASQAENGGIKVSRFYELPSMDNDLHAHAREVIGREPDCAEVRLRIRSVEQNEAEILVAVPLHVPIKREDNYKRGLHEPNDHRLHNWLKRNP